MSLGIYLAETGIPRETSCVPAFEQLARDDRYRVHRLVNDPESADVVLFTECHLHDADWRLRAIVEHPLRKRFRSKAYVYNERDNPWCLLPGVYVSYPAPYFRPAFQQAWAYYRAEDMTEDVASAHAAPDLLFSFMAASSHPCRTCLYDLQHPRALIERTDGFVFFDPSSTDFVPRRSAFRKTLFRSKFVLCPRGAGSSSIRLYEVLSAGRVPVIISDSWVPPTGPDWSSFSVRWPEDRTSGLVEYLEALEPLATTMGVRARTAYEDWFAPDVAFHRLAELLEPMVNREEANHFPLRGIHDARWRQVAMSHARVRLGRARRSVFARLTP